MRRWWSRALCVLAACIAGAGCTSTTARQAASSRDAVTPPPRSAPVDSSSPPPLWSTAATTNAPPVGFHASVVVAGSSVPCPDFGPWAPPAVQEDNPPLNQGVPIRAVVQCQVVDRSYPGIGLWSVQLAEVADTGLAAFVAALEKPSAPQQSSMEGCPAIAAMGWSFAVVDDHGNVRWPSVPTDSCGNPGDALTDLFGLSFRLGAAVRLPAEVVVPALVPTEGCPQYDQDMAAMTTGARPTGWRSGSQLGFAHPPTSVLVCLYHTQHVSTQVKLGELFNWATTHAAVRQIVTALSTAAPIPPACPDAAGFAVLHIGDTEASPTVYVELDACRRVLDSTLYGSATPGLVTAIQAATASS